MNERMLGSSSTMRIRREPGSASSAGAAWAGIGARPGPGERGEVMLARTGPWCEIISATSTSVLITQPRIMHPRRRDRPQSAQLRARPHDALGVMLLGTMKRVKPPVAIGRIVTALSHKRLQSFAGGSWAQLGRVGGATCADSDVLAASI